MLNKDILISKYLSGNASQAEASELENWIAASPENRAEFELSKMIWQTMRPAAEEAADVDAAWDDFKGRTEKKEAKIRFLDAGWLRIAAGFALIACLGLLARFYTTAEDMQLQQVTAENVTAAPADNNHYPDSFLVPAPEMPVFAPEATSTEKVSRKSARKRGKEQRSVALITISAGDSAKLFVLPDTSVVFLNANSTLTYPENFSISQRRLSLEGEAFFDITKDTNQFVIACNQTVVRSAHASFNVKSFEKQQQVEVIIVSGNAEFSGIGKKEFKKLNLTAGEMGLIDNKTDSFVKSKELRKDYKWWRKKGIRERLKRFLERIRRTFNH